MFQCFKYIPLEQKLLRYCISQRNRVDYNKRVSIISGLWGIVSNAGFNVMGDVELLTVSLYNKAMNVNFYGAVRTIKTFLYLVRQSKSFV